MNTRTTNDTILRQLRRGTASFEIVPSPVSSVFVHCTRTTPLFASVTTGATGFFARIGLSAGHVSPAMKKVERYSIKKITGDGRCLFRALVKGMALNKGVALDAREEREGADELRLAVKEIICDSGQERLQYQEALVAITVDEPLKRYCQRIGRPDFWGGEAELLVLSKLCCQPIVVYIPESEHGGRGSGFIPIQEYGAEFHGGFKMGKPKRAVRLLYTGNNHYDLLA